MKILKCFNKKMGIHWWKQVSLFYKVRLESFHTFHTMFVSFNGNIYVASAHWYTSYWVSLPCSFIRQGFRMTDNVSTSKCVWSLATLLPGSLKCFVRLLANILQVKHRFLNSMWFSRFVEWQLKIMSLQSNHQYICQNMREKQFCQLSLSLPLCKTEISCRVCQKNLGCKLFSTTLYINSLIGLFYLQTGFYIFSITN